MVQRHLQSHEITLIDAKLTQTRRNSGGDLAYISTTHDKIPDYAPVKWFGPPAIPDTFGEEITAKLKTQKLSAYPNRHEITQSQE
jgi:hypothetical protein